MILLCRYPPIVMDALQLANAPDIPCVVYERQGLDQTSRESNSSQQSGNIMDWKEAVSKASPHDCVDVEANDPLYILYTCILYSYSYSPFYILYTCTLYSYSTLSVQCTHCTPVPCTPTLTVHSTLTYIELHYL